MSRTRKWGFVAQEATRLAGLGLSPREIAKKLEVSKSTVTRWMKAGKLARGTAAARPAGPVSPRQSPAEWARSVREEFLLSSTDEQLVTLGEAALSLTRDITVPAQLQLAAAGRFQTIVRQLALVMRKEGADLTADEEKPAPASKKNPAVSRQAGDPRKLFMVVPAAVSE